MKTGKELIKSLKEEIQHTKDLISDRHKRINEGLTDMDDCFVSQRSNDLNVSLNEAKISILENGGLWSFEALYFEDGMLASDKIVSSKYGSCWVLTDEAEARYGKRFVGLLKDATYKKKGFKRGDIEKSAWATYSSNGTGMMGAYMASVKIFPSHTNYFTGKTI